MVSSTTPYPVNLNLHGRPVLLVGGGNVATHKIRAMVNSGATVTVVAPQIASPIEQIARQAGAHVVLIRRRYAASDLKGQRLVLTCTDDQTVNEQVYQDAEKVGVWCNSADDPANCAWTLPSVARQGDLQIAISTGGKSPALSMWLRQRFEREFDERWRQLLDVLCDVRSIARAQRGTSELPGWIDGLDSGAADLAFAGHPDRARAHMLAALGLKDPSHADDGSLVEAAR